MKGAAEFYWLGIAVCSTNDASNCGFAGAREWKQKRGIIADGGAGRHFDACWCLPFKSISGSGVCCILSRFGLKNLTNSDIIQEI